MTTDSAPAPQTVAELRQSLAELITESQALRTDVRKAELARRQAEEARRRTNILVSSALAVIAVLIGLVLAVGWQNNQIGKQTQAAAEQAQDTKERMADCTTPGGTCYDESRKRTGGAIADVIRAQLFMAEGARLWPGESGPGYEQKRGASVAERLAGPGLRTPSAGG